MGEINSCFYISCGLGAAFIQTGFYYFQIQNLYEIIELNNLSSSSPDIILEYMSQSDYMAAISGFNSVMVEPLEQYMEF